MNMEIQTDDQGTRLRSDNLSELNESEQERERLLRWAQKVYISIPDLTLDEWEDRADWHAFRSPRSFAPEADLMDYLLFFLMPYKEMMYDLFYHVESGREEAMDIIYNRFLDHIAERYPEVAKACERRKRTTPPSAEDDSVVAALLEDDGVPF